MLTQASIMARRRSGFCYTLGMLIGFGFVALPSLCAWAFDNEESRATLRGVNGIEVGVGEITAEVARSGVTREAIHKEATQRLSRAGLTVVSREELLQRPEAAFLAISVGAIRHPAGSLYAYSIDVSVYQTAMLARDMTVGLSLPTWSIGSFGIVGATNLRSLLNSIGNRVDHFVKAYRTVNPRAEASQTPSVRSSSKAKARAQTRPASKSASKSKATPKSASKSKATPKNTSKSKATPKRAKITKPSESGSTHKNSQAVRQ